MPAGAGLRPRHEDGFPRPRRAQRDVSALASRAGRPPPARDAIARRRRSGEAERGMAAAWRRGRCLALLLRPGARPAGELGRPGRAVTLRCRAAGILRGALAGGGAGPAAPRDGCCPAARPVAPPAAALFASPGLLSAPSVGPPGPCVHTEVTRLPACSAAARSPAGGEGRGAAPERLPVSGGCERPALVRGGEFCALCRRPARSVSAGSVACKACPGRAACLGSLLAHGGTEHIRVHLLACTGCITCPGSLPGSYRLYNMSRFICLLI